MIFTILLIFLTLILENSYGKPEIKANDIEVEIVFQDKVKTSSMTILSNNDKLLLDRDKGQVFKIHNNELYSKPLIDLNVSTMGYRGLLGITHSENYGFDGTNKSFIFLYFTEGYNKDGEDDDEKNPKETKGNRVYRYELSNNALINPKMLLDLPSNPGPRHAGGVLDIGPDDNLYITVGDNDGTFRGLQSDTKAQNNINGSDPDGRSGILRITQDGDPVKGILGSEYPLNLYYAYGIRNSFGLDFDPITGLLWDTENGPHFGDELNIVRPGFNSGWSKVQGIWKLKEDNVDEMSEIFKNTEVDNLVNFNLSKNYKKPIITWKVPVSPTALKFFNSNKLGSYYENGLFVGDANNANLYFFKLNEQRDDLNLNNISQDRVIDDKNEFKEILFGTNFGQRITDLDIGPDGYLYVLSSDKNDISKIFRIFKN